MLVWCHSSYTIYNIVYIYCSCSEAQILFTFENLSRRTVHRRSRALFMRSCSLAFSDSRTHRSVSTARSLSLCSRGVLVRLLQFACCRYLVQHRGCSTLRHSSCIIYIYIFISSDCVHICEFFWSYGSLTTTGSIHAFVLVWYHSCCIIYIYSQAQIVFTFANLSSRTVH